MSKKKNRRTRKPRRPASPRGPIQVVTSLDGGAFDGDCNCPVCVDLAAKGIPMMTVGANGELVEVSRPEPPPMIEVIVRGTASTWPELDTQPRTVEVPAGCVVQDVLGFLQYRDQGLQRGFPPGGLSASIRGEACEMQRMVVAGDELRVSGQRDPWWTEIAKGFAAMPR